MCMCVRCYDRPPGEQVRLPGSAIDHPSSDQRLGLGILAPPNMPTDAAWVGCGFRATPSGPPGTAGADPPDTPLRNGGPLPRPSDRVFTDDVDKWRRLGLGV
ncbi:hypothetical protein ISCGN_000906 [Ixodes scapularis]